MSQYSTTVVSSIVQRLHSSRSFGKRYAESRHIPGLPSAYQKKQNTSIQDWGLYWTQPEMDLEQKYSPLFVALWLELDPKIILLLIERGANVNAKGVSVDSRWAEVGVFHPNVLYAYLAHSQQNIDIFSSLASHGLQKIEESAVSERLFCLKSSL